jgi:hypothetical protein
MGLRRWWYKSKLGIAWQGEVVAGERAEMEKVSSTAAVGGAEPGSDDVGVRVCGQIVRPGALQVCLWRQPKGDGTSMLPYVVDVPPQGGAAAKVAP